MFFLELCPIFISNFISICTQTFPLLCPNYFCDFSILLGQFCPRLCLNYAQRDYTLNFAFATTMPRVLPQLCLNYVLVGYRVSMYPESPLNGIPTGRNPHRTESSPEFNAVVIPFLGARNPHWTESPPLGSHRVYLCTLV